MKYEESPTVELKATLLEEVKHEILAFLNAHGGTVYVGVNDDGSLSEPLSKKGRDDMDSRLGNWIREAFFPIPSQFVKHDFNDDGVLVISIEEGNNKPYFLREKGPKPSGVYVRDGRSTRKANEDEILGMIMSSKDYRFEDDVSETQDLTFSFFLATMKEKGVSVDNRAFVTLGIRRANGDYTNLGLLLSDQSPIQAKVAEYDDKLNFRIKRTYSGSLLKVIRDVQDMCERLNDVSAVIDGSSFERKETISYPGASLREIVLNAFCHANYYVRSNIKIEFFPNECRVTSPGGIYRATLDDLMDGIQTYRNPRLVNIFDKLGLIENFGTGIPRTLEAYAPFGEKPEFKPSENFFIVHLPNLNNPARKQPADASSHDRITDRLNDVCLGILKFVKTHPGARIDEITLGLQNEFGPQTPDSIYNQIKRYLRDYLEFKGPKKSGGYHLK